MADPPPDAAEVQRSLLHAGGGLAGTRQAVEQAEAADQRANTMLALNQEQLRQQELQIDLLDAQQAQARATLKTQQAASRLARLTLGYTRITAPVDGNIGERRVKPDQILRGQVESFSPASGAQFALLPPDNSTGNFTKVVQRVPVKIVFEVEPNLARLLRPGVSAIVTVDAQPR